MSNKMKKTALDRKLDKIRAAEESGKLGTKLTNRTLRKLTSNKLAVIGVLLFLVVCILCFGAPLFTKHDPMMFDLRAKMAAPSAEHILGTDNEGYDIFVRLMYGGRISLTVSFIAVFLITILGVILGGVAGYFGGWVDNVIMRLCDVLMCLPGVPILLIISTILDASDIDAKYRIYLLMIYLTFISWTGTARLVRGQILSLREQEYMVAAEAMGYSTSRKIFKHLIPNVMPQLIVQMSLSLGSMILYEATLSYLNLGVKAPYAAWGSMINIISTNQDILQNHLNVWVPAGVCIVIAVLGFNFVGDGLRDALDPKARR